MSEKIGVAMLSMAHVHADGYANQVEQSQEAKLTAIWDEEPERGRQAAAKRGVPFVGDLDALLARSDVDAVVVNAPTRLHTEVLISAARAGKHIFTEKALTITIAEADRVVQAVRESGVRFMISLPSRCNREILFARRALDEGWLGDVTVMRTRIAHMAALDRWFQPGEGNSGSTWFGDEEAAGGGAFFDLGCHRLDIMRWFLGEPASVVARMNNVSRAYPIDDNMAAVIEFRNKALGIVDVSWVHRSGPNPLEIYGTEGFLSIGATPAGGMLIESQKLSADRVRGVVVPSDLPVGPPSPMAQWFASICEGAETTISLQDGWNLTQLLEGCYTAARTGKAYVF
ncbi:MAG TPA: Gfo/Idh/MocA family oxidoreductase [Chthonomonadales bacterium]|nr:Gfo/Idh/MocA family oxidoreductase [Chthonomonadales bacterium]